MIAPNKLKTFEVFMMKASMMAQYLDQDPWEEYSLMSCDFGISFKSIVFPGISDVNDQNYTLCASSLSCYKLYHKLFEKYLKHNHDVFQPNANHPEMVSMSFENSVFKQADVALV